MGNKIIKTSQHSIKFANSGKLEMLYQFIDDYNEMVWWFVNYFWTTPVKWGDSVMDIQRNKLSVPNFISTVGVNYPELGLSARAVKIASGQAIGIIKSATEKRRKQLYILSKKMSEGEVESVKKLQSKIDSNPLIKPSKTKLQKQLVLNSICCEFISKKTKEFDGWLRISSIGKKYGHIHIPVKMTKHSNRLAGSGYQKNTSWQISTKTINSIWEKEKPPKSTGSRVLGADQGKTTCLSLSDGQITPKCLHGHDLASIIKKMSGKEKASKGFKRTQAHRTNYINWSIKQLDISDVKELRLEKLNQMRKGSNSGRELSHWTYTEINAKVYDRCSELGVPVIEQSATYRSQRCSDCGWTQKSNRKGKEFICRRCGVIHDADINGALNHEADLYRLPYGFWQMHENRAGFYWKSSGLFNVSGEEIAVPHV